jgi:hypothetical protein
VEFETRLAHDRELAFIDAAAEENSLETVVSDLPILCLKVGL